MRFTGRDDRSFSTTFATHPARSRMGTLTTECRRLFIFRREQRRETVHRLTHTLLAYCRIIVGGARLPLIELVSDAPQSSKTLVPKRFEVVRCHGGGHSTIGMFWMHTRYSTCKTESSTQQTTRPGYAMPFDSGSMPVMRVSFEPSSST